MKNLEKLLVFCFVLFFSDASICNFLFVFFLLSSSIMLCARPDATRPLDGLIVSALVAGWSTTWTISVGFPKHRIIRKICLTEFEYTRVFFCCCVFLLQHTSTKLLKAQVPHTMDAACPTQNLNVNKCIPACLLKYLLCLALTHSKVCFPDKHLLTTTNTHRGALSCPVTRVSRLWGLS